MNAVAPPEANPLLVPVNSGELAVGGRPAEGAGTADGLVHVGTNVASPISQVRGEASEKGLQKVYYRDWQASRLVPFAFLFSRAAAPVSRRLALRGVRPNQVTLAVAFLGGMAIANVALGAWWTAAVALVGFLFFDHVDGQIARLTDQRTSLGGYLDTLADLVVDVLFLGAIVAWGVFHDIKVALLGLMALVSYAALELVGRHGGWTTVLEALRAKDFRPRDGLPTIAGSKLSPIVPHRDLNIVVLALGLITGWLHLALAGLTVWWTAWTLHRIAQDVERPKNTQGVLASLMHEDNH